MTELYLDQLTFDRGKSPLCHPAYHVAATIFEGPPEVLFELVEGVLVGAGAATKLHIGRAKLSRTSRKE